MKKSVFSSASVIVLVAASFFLAACNEVLEDNKALGIEKSDEKAVAKNEIARINLSGVIAPVKDGVPATELTVPETADYTVGVIEWQNTETEEVLATDAKFEAGVSYRAAVPLTAKEGKAFTESSKVKVGQIQIGDSESEIESYEIALPDGEGEEAILTVTYKAAPVKPLIKTMRENKAYVIGLRAPAVGETPRNLSLDPEDAEDADYDENKSGILSVPFSTAGFTVIYDPAQTKWLNADTTFVAGKKYKAQITIRANDDRVFGDKVDVLFGYTKVTDNYKSSDLEDSKVFAKKEATVSSDRKTARLVLTFKAL
ncbi:MAG: hypothetical protein Ta2F_14100 [Termitinemataceae bacterium]|nr:MAG: hypothetical protein Ta2F_14100 [Termitinemataceae bacterium]